MSPRRSSRRATSPPSSMTFLLLLLLVRPPRDVEAFSRSSNLPLPSRVEGRPSSSRSYVVEPSKEDEDVPSSSSLVDRRSFFAASSLLTAMAATTAVPKVASAGFFDEADSRGMTTLIANAVGGGVGGGDSVAGGTGGSGREYGAPSKKLGGLPRKIRNVGRIMDELQRDLMQERWDLVSAYPPSLRSLVPLFTSYTDAAFPTDAPTDVGLRVALRYEVGRFFAGVERLKQAAKREALNEAYVAYSDMSLHFDRYLRVGGLYTYYDSNITTEVYFKGIKDDSLVYADPLKDPAEVRDLIVLASGPDKGKTGIVIGIYPDGSGNCVVKLDKYKGMREIKVVPRKWAGKRLGEQDPDDVFLIPRS